MLTFTNLGKYGRLGNQLYQYAALKATCLRNGYVCKIPDISKNIWHGQQCLLDNFNIESEFLTEKDYKEIQNLIIEPNDLPGRYYNILENPKDNSDLLGFFQNTKYFIDFEKQIKNELNLKKQLTDVANINLNKLRKNNSKIVSLHIRRGDLVDGTNPTYNKYFSEDPFDKNTVFGDYLTKSLDLFYNKNVIYLVFVGGSRSGNDKKDIEWAKKHFNKNCFIVSDTNDPIKDFALMSQCDHNIMSFASTFSWWACFVNTNCHKTVIAPQNFHLDNIKREDFYMQDWKLI